MTKDKKTRGELTDGANADELAAFLEKIARVPAIKTARGRGRLIFAMDATASREPTWDRACHIQAEMFQGNRRARRA